jgi:hypothetical protein
MVYCQNYMKHINTLCGEVTDYFSVKVGGIYSNLTT